MSIQFTKAVKTGSKLRLALIGPSGSGKTYTALKVASELGQRVAVIDTEHGSASKYADEFEFDTLQMTNYDPVHYMDAIASAEAAGYDVIVVDSLSHAWSGKGGALEMVDKVTSSSKSGNSYVAWAKVTPIWNDLLDAIVRVDAHLIGTMRAKTEYVLDSKNTPRKVGMGAVFRDGGEYEFDVVGEMTLDHSLVVTKTRCRDIDGAVIEKPGAGFAETLNRWLEGEPLPEVAEIDALGEALLGKTRWHNEARTASAMSLSGNLATTIEQLTQTEAQKLLSQLKRKMDKKEAEEKAQATEPATETA